MSSNKLTAASLDSMAELQPPKASGDGARRRITTNELFRGDKELTIVHADEHYQLRITRNHKLILTK